MPTGVNKYEYYLMRKMGKTISQHRLIQDKDKIVVALSGGKDSLSLLRLLTVRQKYSPVKYELLAVHVDFGFNRAYEQELKNYLEKEGYRYHIEKRTCVLKPGEKMNCFWCSWNRRKAIFEVADKFGFSKIALAHNKDDLVETALLNLFYHSEFSTMLPSLEFFQGRFTVIRPLIDIEAAELKRYAEIMGLPYSNHTCPFQVDSATKRAKMRELINMLAKENPHVKRNILRSLERKEILYKPRRMFDSE